MIWFLNKKFPLRISYSYVTFVPLSACVVILLLILAVLDSA